MAFSESAVAGLKARAQRDIDEGNIPACQYALALNGDVVVAETLGSATERSRFSCWSSTKPVFASVVWQLMGEGKLDPDAPVVEYWPEFGANGKEKVTLDHLLLFTAGFPNAKPDLETVGDRSASVKQMEQWSLEWEPGTAYAYHGFSAHAVMAELVTRVTGTDHRVALRERILDPLGLDRLELGVPKDRIGDVLLMHEAGEPSTSEEVAEALGLPALPPALAEFLDAVAGGAAANPAVNLADLEQPHVRAAGLAGAGAVSDASSMALFYQELLHNSHNLWDPAVLHDATTNVRNTFAGDVLGVIAMRTRGLEVQGDDPTARSRIGGGQVSPRTFGHGGASGQIAWADPDSGLSFAYLTNGTDRNAVREAKRTRELSAAAIHCVAR